MSHPRNPGTELDLAWVAEAQVNLAAVKRRSDQHKTRRSVKKDWQAAWYLRAITCVDLTTLAGDDTEGNVRKSTPLPLANPYLFHAALGCWRCPPTPRRWLLALPASPPTPRRWLLALPAYPPTPRRCRR